MEWASTKDDVDAIKEKLGISDGALRKIQSEVQSLFDGNRYGFPNIFASKDDALRFRSTHLAKIDCRVIRLSLPEPFHEEALAELKPAHEDGESGIYRNLKAGIADENPSRSLGYEILCWDMGGFHSFICNGLEKDYEEKLQLKFNANGFFDDPDSALKTVEYTRRDEVGAEPGFWAPFRLNQEA